MTIFFMCSHRGKNATSLAKHWPLHNSKNTFTLREETGHRLGSLSPELGDHRIRVLCAGVKTQNRLEARANGELRTVRVQSCARQKYAGEAIRRIEEEPAADADLRTHAEREKPGVFAARQITAQLHAVGRRRK